MKKDINIDLCKIKKNGEYGLDKEACIALSAQKYEVSCPNSRGLYARVSTSETLKVLDMQLDDFNRELRNLL